MNSKVYLAASPTSYLDADDPPFFLYHGTSDFMVPVSSPMKMKTALETVGIKVMMKIGDKGHLSTFSDFDRLDEGLDFLKEVLCEDAR